MMHDPLPNTLSELIRVAVADARKLDHHIYSPNWLEFHRGYKIEGRYICQICDAGAVIAGTLQAGHFVGDRAPVNYPETVHRKLNALDEARKGYYNCALHIMGIDCDDSESVSNIATSPYRQYSSWEHFDLHMYHMALVADQLEELGY